MGAASKNPGALIGGGLGTALAFASGTYPILGLIAGGALGMQQDATSISQKKAQDQMSALAGQQASQANALKQSLLEQPKQVAPDNFLEMKNNALKNLRLGIMSTITGAGSAPSTVLSRPTLTGSGPGKTKLGQ